MTTRGGEIACGSFFQHTAVNGASLVVLLTGLKELPKLIEGLVRDLAFGMLAFESTNERGKGFVWRESKALQMRGDEPKDLVVFKLVQVRRFDVGFERVCPCDPMVSKAIKTVHAVPRSEQDGLHQKRPRRCINGVQPGLTSNFLEEELHFCGVFRRLIVGSEPGSKHQLTAFRHRKAFGLGRVKL